MKNTLILSCLFLIFSCQSSDKNNFSPQLTTENKPYDIAWEFYEKSQNDSAYVYFNQAKDLYLLQKNKIQAAKCLVNMGYISNDKGDWFGSQELTIFAIKLLNPKIKEEKEVLSSAYNSLGQSIHELGNYKEAINYYQKSTDLNQDREVRIINENNIANSYRYNKQFNEAINGYQTLLKDSLIYNHPKEYARVLDNLAYTEWLQDVNRDVEDKLNKALNIRIKEKDKTGINASYAHLIDYFSKKDKEKALNYAYKRKDIAFESNSSEDKLETYQKLITLENSENSKKYFEAYQKLNDSVEFERNKAKNQFALVRYDSEKNKADFLKAEAENEKKQNDILKLYIIVGLLFFGLIGAYFWYKRRKQKLEEQKLLEVKNTELKYSKKVHDKVANGIYQILSEVENNQSLGKNELLDKLEDVYEISRDISYDKKDDNLAQNFTTKLAEMMKAYSSDEVLLFILGNEDLLWKNTSTHTKTEIYIIIQELLTNMKKHSEASRVVLKFSQENNQITINYTDNGIGISVLKPKNGLQNTGNRIKSINGQLIFETENINGLKITISFPNQ
ncbi:hypothetical protein [Algoriella sp.]|uniref:tetratricopeptide repeat-containing sensor histidine kinase n=1 Tax=Algoriella sp. TaxID=1872434 RepID=UPI00257DA7F8|nr:hypothetical protein [Algoriella sp.]